MKKSYFKNNYFKKAFFYGIFFVISLYVIFFVGKSFNDETKKTETNYFSVTGYKDFKLGMDIAGGVKLTYKLDFSSYGQIYTNEYELNQVKNDIINVITKKIDKRISTLGVSDYKVYKRTYDEKDYLIVDIGGVTNLEEAKNIIGKTITLHFKIPSQKQDKKIEQSRENLVNKIYKQIQKTPNNMKQVSEDNSSVSDIYYNKYEKVSTIKLPLVYTNILNQLDETKTGTLLPIQKGLYHMSMTKKGNNSISGWTIIKVNNKQIKKTDKISLQSIASVVQRHKFKYERQYSFDAFNIKEGDLGYKDGKLIYNDGKFFTGQMAYKMSLYQVAKPNFLGKQGDELKKLQKEYDELVEKTLEKVKNGEKPENAVKVTEKQRIASSDISKYIPGFSGSIGVNKSDSLDAVYISNVYEIKTTDKDLFLLTEIEGVSENQVQQLKEEMKTEILYDIEEIFIKNQPTWETAVDPISKQILDAKFFEYATVGASPTGQPVVQLHFNTKGEEVFCHISEDNIGKPLAIFIGENPEPVTVATIRSKICGSSPYIEGNFTSKEAKDMVQELNEGAFPVKMDLESEEKVNPILGQKAIIGSLYAGGLGIILIFIFLFFMYGIKKALVGFIVLVAYAVYLLAILKSPIVDYAFSLSGIAAIILALGMAVDANILIFERIIEESKDKNINSAIDEAVERSWSPILDGNLSTGLVALVLALVGMSIFRGFGTMIIVTMLIILFVNIKLTKTLLHLFYDKNKK